ncbi:MAG TPA: LysE family translocator [Anaerolineae bacterium]|nr:LysE family translocator [Anaerolineae bacterium]
MSESPVVGFALVSFAIIVIPGPSVLFAVSRAISDGRRPALLTVLGNAAGLFAQVVVVAIGLGVVVSGSTEVYTALKLVGAAYLVWLGVDAIRHRERTTAGLDPGTAGLDSGPAGTSSSAAGESRSGPAGTSRSAADSGSAAGESRSGSAASETTATADRSMAMLRDGFVVGASNPKSIVFLAALLPQYVQPAVGMAAAQMVLLGALFCTIAIVCDSAWVLAASTARRWLGDEGRRRAASVAAGLVMIALGALLLLSG